MHNAAQVLTPLLPRDSINLTSKSSGWNPGVFGIRKPRVTEASLFKAALQVKPGLCFGRGGAGMAVIISTLLLRRRPSQY